MLAMLLLLLAAMYLRPVRSWIDQVVIARAIHPNLRIREIHLHPRSVQEDLILIQANHFDWGGTQGDYCVGIASESAWFLVESTPLWRKQFSIPRALIPDARLTMVRPSKTLDGRAFDRRSLDGRAMDSVAVNLRESSRRVSPYSCVDSVDGIEGLATPTRSGLEPSSRSVEEGAEGEEDWHFVQQQVDERIRVDDLIAECRDRIGHWISQSEMLTQQAEQLAANLDRKENPLRNQFETQVALDSIHQLLERKRLLSAEVDAVQSLMSEKLNEMGQLSDQLREEIQADLAESLLGEAVDEVKASSREIARRLIEASGQTTLDRIHPYAEVAERLSRAGWCRSDATSVRDVREAGTELLSIGRLSAEGIFQSPSVQSPFRLALRCTSTQNPTGRPTIHGQMQFEFCSGHRTVQVSLQHRTEQSPWNDLLITLKPATGDGPTLAGSQSQRPGTGLPHCVIQSDGHSIRGSLRLNSLLLDSMIEIVPPISEALNAAKKASPQPGDISPLILSLDGSWEDARCHFSSDRVPEWLRSAVEELEQQQLENDHRRKMAQLDRCLEQTLDRLDQELTAVLDQARQSAGQTSQRLLVIRQMVEQQAESQRELEFARSGQDDEIQR
jgi:hypothetical protein